MKFGVDCVGVKLRNSLKVAMNQRTDFLVPASSFLLGVGSLLNFSGDYIEYNQSRTTAGADRRAIANDWAIVGQDIRHAMREFEAEVGQKKSPNTDGKE